MAGIPRDLIDRGWLDTACVSTETRDLMNHSRHGDGKIRGDHAAIAVDLGELVASTAVHEHACPRGVHCTQALCQQRADHAGEHVPAATGRECGTAGRIDRAEVIAERAIAYDRARALHHDDGT